MLYVFERLELSLGYPRAEPIVRWLASLATERFYRIILNLPAVAARFLTDFRFYASLFSGTTNVVMKASECTLRLLQFGNQGCAELVQIYGFLHVSGFYFL